MEKPKDYESFIIRSNRMSRANKISLVARGNGLEILPANTQ